MSERYAIVVDGTAAVPEALRREWDIAVLPLHVLFGDTSYTAGVDLESDDFYRKLAEVRALPTTSAPSLGECLDLYESLARDGAKAIVVLTIMAEKSTTHAIASTTAQQFTRARVEVVDSRTTAGGMTLIATACARLRRSGRPFDDALALARRLAGRVEILAVVDTLEYLRRGGRVTGAQAMLGSLLAVKPIVEVKDGETVVIDKVRTRERGVARLHELVESRLAPGARIHACTLHTNAPERARALGDWVQERFHCLEHWVAEAGPVIAVHTGSGVVGVCWYRAEAGPGAPAGVGAE